MGVPSYIETIGYSNEGDVPLNKNYMVVFDDKLISVLTNSLKEVNEYLDQNYKNKYEQGFAIIDITDLSYKLDTDKEYLKSFVDKLSEVITSLNIKIK